ncbi:pyridoxal 5'-phosphate synthase glutaminase subunit PdxT [Agromyces archimandritae]|uniref:Pyridoxal 5'-phosphate synthase subunit PdxT n=1 Tax=Agromyces archimandritae TaxID=2781962 RepID=A0A975FQW9_9MICO|nr:pyridoxal 5'-phosphate synthase glutaminase subunit PdxT [Agromyces archimandritae]
MLALQGGVREHERMLDGLGATVVRVRRPEELAGVDGLVIPGGESTVIARLAALAGLTGPIRVAIGAGMPMLGTCAGLILLADALEDAAAGQETFGGLDIVARRNAFGAQTESFETLLDVPDMGEEPVRAAFIRGPVVASLGPAASALARHDDGRIVAVEQGALLATAFHPELTGETRFHERFLGQVRAAAA